MSPRAWAGASLVLGLLLVHLSWIAAVPPFRGIDEFDHVYRAASVAHGQVRPYSEAVADGRGDYVRVPDDIVEAAAPVCDTYAYVGPDNCFPAEELDDGMVKVASAAARYHPLYYGVVGLVAKPWSGAEFVYAARVATALLCVGLWGLAILAALRSQAPRLTLFALGIAATPVLVYSGAVVAPNGLEIAAAVACWTAFLAMDHRQSASSERLLLIVAAFSAVMLVTLRTLGPVWLLLLVLTVLFLPGRESRLALLGRHRLLTFVSVVSVGSATALSVWWVLSARTNSLAQESSNHFPDPWFNSLTSLPLWVLQSIAAFPTRNEQAPTVVYAAVLAAIIVALLTAPGLSQGGWWWALGTMTVVWLVPPLILTAVTYVESGAIWQGRYSLPYSVGILLVLLTWRRPRGAPNAQPRLGVLAVCAAYAIAQTVSVVSVRRDEIVTSPLSGDPQWITAPEPLLIALSVVGTALIFLSAWLLRPEARQAPVPAPSSARERVPAK